nr:MAG TPA: hypothetical protein [Caudoviricetes sp.]
MTKDWSCRINIKHFYNVMPLQSFWRGQRPPEKQRLAYLSLC